ncbi:autophagic serine protease Alp2 [Mortierella sp. GBAus27b]|nr:serine protease [Mortierella sp. GBA43]KAI8363230.1 autophagic serine protease Alp2 [Mortierella sp. GBAus27b]
MMLKLSTVAALLLAASSAVAAPHCMDSENRAPVISSVEATTIPDSYFVVFKDGVKLHQQAAWISDLHQRDMVMNSAWHRDLDQELTSGVRHVYDMDSLQGLAGRFSPDVLEEIRKNPDVDYVERDQFVYTTAAIEVQTNAPWGLARISHRDTLNLFNRRRYYHDPTGGEGVTVFVIDTGINIGHRDFQGRASWGSTIPYGDRDIDGNGHGTHCAGTIASKTYGVAKKAKVVAVKVLGTNGVGTMSDVVAGVEYALKRHTASHAQEGAKYKGSVANMSLGGGKSRPLESAITGAIRKGMHVAAAAGNDNRDACNYSPGGTEAAVTVAASDVDDARAYYSNHGRCVDVFAPGTNIESTWKGGPNARNTISGTSMASPHVAGLIAYYLSLAPTTESAFHTGPITPQEMKDLLKSRATTNTLRDVDSNTPNLLVFNGGKTGSYYAW